MEVAAVEVQSLVVRLCAGEDVLVVEVGGVVDAPGVDDRIGHDEGGQQTAVVDEKETAHEVEPDHPVAEAEQEAEETTNEPSTDN